MARYAGLLLAPAESFNQGFFCPSRKKKELIMCFGLFLANPKKLRKTKKIFKKSKKKPKNSKNLKKSKNP